MNEEVSYSDAPASKNLFYALSIVSNYFLGVVVVGRWVVVASAVVVVGCCVVGLAVVGAEVVVDPGLGVS